MVLSTRYINPANGTPVVRTCHASDSGHLLFVLMQVQVKLSRSGERLQDHWSSSMGLAPKTTM